jgi:hypothetical protein
MGSFGVGRIASIGRVKGGRWRGGFAVPNGLLRNTGDVTFAGSSCSNLRRNRANTSGTLSARKSPNHALASSREAGAGMERLTLPF